MLVYSGHLPEPDFRILLHGELNGLPDVFPLTELFKSIIGIGRLRLGDHGESAKARCDVHGGISDINIIRSYGNAPFLRKGVKSKDGKSRIDIPTGGERRQVLGEGTLSRQEKKE